MYIHMCNFQEAQKQMCPVEMFGKNDLKGVSWLRTNCNSLISKESGAKDNPERPKRASLTGRWEGTVAPFPSQPMTE